MSMIHTLAADVGGTNARLAWVDVDVSGRTAPVVGAALTYACADFPGLAQIIERFRAEHPGEPQALALGCAGLLHGREVLNGNLPWRLLLDPLEDAAGHVPLHLSNDFEALARATRWLATDEGCLLHGPEASIVAPARPIVVLGPGTGLGAALRIPQGEVEIVLPTEGGRPGFAPATEEEAAVLAQLRLELAEGGHVDTEAVLSGPGLLRVYRCLGRLHGLPALAQSPAAVSAGSADGSDALARRTVEFFWGALASACGNSVLALGAYGGVLLAGGILPRLMHAFDGDRFAERFKAKGVMWPVLEQVPVRLIEHGQLGIVGAAMAVSRG
jgi:glucokinase